MGDKMEIHDFVLKAIVQDNRNIFEKNNKIIDCVPARLLEFYTEANPVDVEVSMDGNPVHFYPIDDLADLQEDYDLSGDRFVFATCNGDPIYYMDGRIYTCCHGASKTEDELMASDICLFFDLIESLP